MTEPHEETPHDAPIPEQEGAQSSATEDAASVGDSAADMDGLTQEEINDPAVELQAVKGELEVLEDRYLRTRAEFDNFRRRSAQDLQSSWARAQADFVSSLLSALDDLQRVGGWEASTTTIEALIEGVDLVERNFNKALTAAGVEMIEPKPRAVFDPNVMEAMLRVETDDTELDDRVERVFARGYQLGDSLIRPARVAVYKSD